MNRLEFVKFLEEFKKDFDKNKSEWENTNLSDFLESMIRYTEDVQGYYDNMKMDIDADKPTWENFTQILRGASIYE